MSWLSIESAPKDGSLVVCRGACSHHAKTENDFYILIWKTNRRIVEANKEGAVYICDGGKQVKLLESYFGDPIEWDDYELAVPGNGPTHWYPIDPFE